MGVEMGEGPLNDLWTFDTVTKAWTLLTDKVDAQGGPSQRSFHQMVRPGRKDRGLEDS